MRISSRLVTLGVAASLLALVGASLVDAQRVRSRSAPETAAVAPKDTLVRPGLQTDTGSRAVRDRWHAKPTPR